MPLDKSRIRLICFDIDGTLRDTDDQFVLRLQQVLHPFQFLFPNRDTRSFARRVVMKTESPGNLFLSFADRLHVDSGLARLGDFIYRLGLGNSEETYLLIPGIIDMLAHLQERYQLAIVSARGKRTTSSFLEKCGLVKFFQRVADGQTCRYTKPRPDPILWVASQLRIPPQACLMVGDTTVDIRSGKSAGAQTVAVLCGFGEEEELIRAGADAILDSTAHLAVYLDD